MLVSIVITNYNYAEFLEKCIESALSQSWSEKEIIVVDDGSTDQSSEIINRYGSVITAIFKDNGGQCSAANAGFAISRGDIVIFLDSDDYLIEDAVRILAEPMGQDRSISKCQGYLMVIDSTGTPTGETIPKKLSPSGNYRKMTLRHGPDAWRFTYTSGSAWASWFLKQVMPLPVPDFKRMGVDGYLNSVSTLFGRTESIKKNVAAYRVHGRNQGPVGTTFTAESLRQRACLIEITQKHLLHWANRLGYSVPADVLQKWSKSQRHFLLSYSLNAIDKSPQQVRFGEFVLSPFYSCHTSRIRSLFLSALLSVLWLLPQRYALELARRMLKIPKPAS